MTNKIWLIILIILCMTFCSNKINLSGKSEVDVVAGDEMIANGEYWASVGIDFTCEISDTSIVKLVDSEVKLVNPGSDMPGSDEGTKYLTFIAKSPGTVKITFFKDFRGELEEIGSVTVKVVKRE